MHSIVAINRLSFKIIRLLFIGSDTEGLEIDQITRLRMSSIIALVVDYFHVSVDCWGNTQLSLRISRLLLFS